MTRLLLCLTAVLSLGCAHATNLTDPSGPRISGRGPARDRAAPDTLLIATLNLRHGKAVDELLAIIRRTPELIGADLLALQEMDDVGTRRIAQELGWHFVYYPAVIHPETGRYFGNALLSPWPIETDGKLILPVRSLTHRSQRIAVRGTLRLGTARVRVYSVHLASLLDVIPPDQQRQWAAVLEEADTTSLPVVIAGDINGEDPGGEAAHRDFARLTSGVGATHLRFSLDQIFIRGFEPVRLAAGRIQIPASVSDHHAVWAKALLRRANGPRPKPYAQRWRRATRRVRLILDTAPQSC